jgi:hypothetical protein
LDKVEKSVVVKLWPENAQTSAANKTPYHHSYPNAAILASFHVKKVKIGLFT